MLSTGFLVFSPHKYLSMKTVTALAFSLLLIGNLHSQETSSSINPISIADLNLKSCSFEPDANAMKLLDIQAVEYEPSAFGGRIVTSKTVRIKIFNEKGYRDATILIPYFNNKKNTKIETMKAAVYSLDANGQIAKEELKAEDFYNEKAMDKLGVIRFTYPNLRPGNIVEYSYTMSEKNRLVVDNWVVQSQIPCAYAETSVIIPEYSALKDYTFGLDSVLKRKEKITKGLDRNKHTYFKKEIRSFQPEPLMTSVTDNLLRVGFVLIPDNKIFLDDFSTQTIWRFTANNFLKSSMYNEMVSKVIPGTESIIDTAMTYPDKEQRFRYLYSVLKKRIPNKSGRSVSDDLGEAWKKKTATSTEINFLLHNLLSRAEIKNYLVFVSTREHGKVNREFPSIGQFNQLDVIVDINGTKFLTDASLKYQSYNIPPIDVLNREALILNPDQIGWAMITDDRPLLRKHLDIFGKITTNGVLEGGATINYFDYAKALALDTSLNNESSSTDKFFEKKTAGLKLLKQEKTAEKEEDPLTETIEFDYDLQNQGDFYFIKPAAFSNEKLNYFTKETRITEIDFGCNQEIRLNLQLDIPANLKVEELPKNITVKSADESIIFTRLVSVSQSKLSYTHTIQFRKAIFSTEEYKPLLDFFKSARAYLTEEIILKKI